MRKQKSVQLIKGRFSAAEAKDVLHNLIGYKINFHELKSFSEMIRLGTKDKQSDKRVEQLKESRAKLLQYLDEAEKHGYKLKIESTILVQLEQ